VSRPEDDRLRDALAPVRAASPPPGAAAAAVAAARAPRRRAVRALTAGAAVAVCALAVLLAGGGAGTPAPLPALPPAQADPLLRRAAVATAAQPAPPAPRDDQYLYAAELLRETRFDGRGAPRTFVDEHWISVDASRPTRTSERGRSWTTRPADGMWPPARSAELAELPTEPTALRRAILDWGPAEPGDVAPRFEREEELTALLLLLRGRRVLPPRLRAAVFGALAQVPGVRVREGVADALGRRGLGISAPGLRGYGYELVVDARTYGFLGMRGRLVRGDGVAVEQVFALVDAGVVDALGERPPPGPLTVRAHAPSTRTG
jgi:hypothetical protein